jgi:hypothetical protein
MNQDSENGRNCRLSLESNLTGGKQSGNTKKGSAERQVFPTLIPLREVEVTMGIVTEST